MFCSPIIIIIIIIIIITFVEWYYSKDSGERKPQILSSRAACWSALIKAVSLWPFIAEARAKFQVGSCVICGEQCDSETSTSLSTSVFLHSVPFHPHTFISRRSYTNLANHSVHKWHS